MTENDTTDDAEQGENHAAGMSSEEIRAEALDMVGECDGALIITATLDDDEDSVGGAAIKFVRDDLDDEDRVAVHGSLLSGADRARAHEDRDDDDGPSEALAALAAILSGGMAAEVPEEYDDDGFESMFA